MSMNTQGLHDLIAELGRQRDTIDERLRLVGELLATYDDTTPPTAPPAKPSVPAARRPASASVDPCPKCGQVAKSNAGRSQHVKHCRVGDNVPKTLAAVPDQPPKRDPLDTFGDDVYVCATCKHEEPNSNGMRGHTMRMHSRPATELELRAVAS